MAIRTAKTKIAPATDAGTIAYSTRFDDKQRALIEDAARVLNWAPAKLIREAAVRRAADIVNGSGDAELVLRTLASRVLDHLLDPEKEAASREEGGRKMRRLLADGDIDERDTWIETGSAQDVHGQIKKAMRESGTRFLECLLQEWEKRTRGTVAFKPTVSADELLKGD